MISCVCVTHGRAHVIGEAVESYLRQSYIGERELLILNDCPEQPLVCDLPGVRVVNLTDMFQDVSVKFNCAVSMARGEYVAWWEDDDISLPHRLEVSMAAMASGLLGAYKQGRCWFSVSNRLQGMSDNLFFGSAIFRRDCYLASGGARPGEPADQSAWASLERHAACHNALPAYPYFIYRWGGGLWHDSGTKGTNADRFAAFRKGTLEDRHFLPGPQTIVPGWKMDYEAQVLAWTPEIL